MAGNIVVTGFGPFGEHKINASWEAVKLLPKEISGYNVIKEEVTVSYDTVDKKIHLLWKEHNPRLVVHVGVSSLTDKVTLESCAYKEGYCRQDCLGNTPLCGNKCAASCTENCIRTGINVKEIRDHLNNTKSVKACVSKDAGRYLCEYIFYTSLSIDKEKTIFIHVPPLDKPYSAEEFAESILEIINYIVNQQSSNK